jgi:NAD-specific glutamate dehydrogenase
MPEWRPMNEVEQRAAIILGRLRYPAASWSKRFAASLAQQAAATPANITDAQAAALWLAAYRFRRQITDKAILALASEAAAKEPAKPWVRLFAPPVDPEEAPRKVPKQVEESLFNFDF